MGRIGIADTTFARVNMGRIAEETIKANSQHAMIRYTVPGIKDLPVACKKLFEEDSCDIVLACGMVGQEKIDKLCGHEASVSIQQVQLINNKHILEVFVHMDEARDESDLYQLTKNRVSKHALNAIALLQGKTALTPLAGTGRRQGKEDVGQILEDLP